jgi:hypothetical protein
MFRETGLVRAVSVFTFVAFLGFIAGGCVGGFLPTRVEDEGLGGLEIKLEQLENTVAIVEEIPEVTIEDISPSSTTVRIVPSSGLPYTVKMLEGITPDGQRYLTVFINETEAFRLPYLQRPLVSQSLGGPRLEPQAGPAIAVGLAVVIFVAECGRSLYDSFKAVGFDYRKLDKKQAATACISTGAGAVAGAVVALGVKHPQAAVIVQTAVSLVVTELINSFSPGAWSSLTAIYDALKTGYKKIADAISKALNQLSVLINQAVAPTITGITLDRQTIKVNSSATITVSFSDPDKDVTQGRIESRVLFIWFPSLTWKGYDYFNKSEGQIRYTVFCRAAGTFTARAFVGDYGDRWSTPKEFKVICVK